VREAIDTIKTNETNRVDKYTIITQTGYISRIGSSFVGVPIGLGLIAGGVALQWWNESRMVSTQAALDEAGSNALTIGNADAMCIEERNEGKLVHTYGQVTTRETLSDEEFSFQSSSQVGEEALGGPPSYVESISDKALAPFSEGGVGKATQFDGLLFLGREVKKASFYFQS